MKHKYHKGANMARGDFKGDEGSPAGKGCAQGVYDPASRGTPKGDKSNAARGSVAKLSARVIGKGVTKKSIH